MRYDACIAYAGEAYTEYTTQDFWDIVSAWRIPLIALIATTPLPAFGFSSWVFAIVHMLADPIDTLWSLFYKLSLAHRHEEWALNENENGIFSLTGEGPGSSITSTETHTSQTLNHGDSSTTIAGPSGGSIAPANAAANNQQSLASQVQTADNDIQAASTNSPEERHTAEPHRTSSEEGPVNPTVRRSDFTFLGGIGSVDRDQREEAARRSEPKKFQRLDAKAVALIINAYDDWHFMELAKALISHAFR